MIKLFSSTDTLFATNGDKIIIIPLKAKFIKKMEHQELGLVYSYK